MTFADRIRELALSLPETYEDEPWGHPVFKVADNRMFASMSEDGRTVLLTVKLTAEEREIASTNLVTIDPQQDLDDALRLMASNQVRRLPVVEEDGRLVGVVAQKDVAEQGDDAKTGEVVQEISQG